METNTNGHNTRRTFIDIAENMLEMLPGDIIIIRPKPKEDE